MELNLREIRPEDINGFNDLMDELTEHAFDQEKLKKIIQRTIDNPEKYLLVAVDGDTGTVCGSMLGVLFDDYCDECRPILVVENVVTKKEYRRMGIASAMFTEMENWGRKHDANYCILCSGLNRVEAHKFYKDIGYDEIKGYKKYLS